MSAMEIGGVRYLIRGENSDWAGHLCAFHQAFIRESTGDSDSRLALVDVRIFMRREPLPDAAAMDLVHNESRAWAMYRQGENHVMVYRPPVFENSLWAARFDRDGTRVDVFHSEEALHYPFPPFSHPLDQMILVFALSAWKGALVHAAGLGINGKGFVFAGKSGAGKSTVSRLFDQAGRFNLLSDERVVLRELPEGFRVYGTPWHSDAYISGAADLPLRAMFFLHHGDENTLVRCNPARTLELLLPLVSIPWFDRERMTHTMDFLGRMIEAIPCFDLYFRPDQGITMEMQEFAEKLG